MRLRLAFAAAAALTLLAAGIALGRELAADEERPDLELAAQGAPGTAFASGPNAVLLEDGRAIETYPTGRVVAADGTIAGPGFTIAYPERLATLDDVRFPTSEAVGSGDLERAVVGVDRSNWIAARPAGLDLGRQVTEAELRSARRLLDALFGRIARSTPGTEARPARRIESAGVPGVLVEVRSREGGGTVFRSAFLIGPEQGLHLSGYWEEGSAAGARIERSYVEALAEADLDPG
jgi:hypothetical protein